MADVEPSSGASSLKGVRGFFLGMTYPMRGVTFLFGHSGLWVRAALPALMTLLLVGGFTYLAFDYVGPLAELVLPDSLDASTAWYARVGSAIATFFAVLLCLLAGGVVGFVAALPLAGPLNEVLARGVQRIHAGKTLTSEQDRGGLLSDIGRAIITAVQRVLIFGVIYVPLLLLSLIPVVGLGFTALLFIYSAFFLAMTFLEPSQDLHQMSSKEKFSWARVHLAPYMGFGVSCVLLTLIPCASLLLAPALVVGGTLLWVDAQKGC